MRGECRERRWTWRDERRLDELAALIEEWGAWGLLRGELTVIALVLGRRRLVLAADAEPRVGSTPRLLAILDGVAYVLPRETKLYVKIFKRASRMVAAMAPS